MSFCSTGASLYGSLGLAVNWLYWHSMGIQNYQDLHPSVTPAHCISINVYVVHHSQPPLHMKIYNGNLDLMCSIFKTFSRLGIAISRGRGGGTGGGWEDCFRWPTNWALDHGCHGATGAALVKDKVNNLPLIYHLPTILSFTYYQYDRAFEIKLFWIH